MEAKTTKRQYNTVLSQAKKAVPGFALSYGRFIEKTTLEQSSKGLIVNYSRSLAYIALHFSRVPHQISVEEINAYLCSMMVHEKCSLSYFKHAVFALRYWFRLFGMEDKAIQMPPIKKEKKLPVVLSREECKELFKAPVNLKHRSLLTFAYAGGLRMNELRLIKISDVDLHRRHPKQMYDLLFAASHQTIKSFAHDEKHLGAMAGMISILHTWGQNLSLHPHVHLIIPGGGIAPSGCWKKVKSNGRFLFPVKAMSVVFKNKYMEGFLQWLNKENKTIEPSVRETLYNKSWIVYAKSPFGGPQQVIEYLGRYTHKVAISNHRIVSIENDKISFTYKDYADGGKQKVMTLEATEFLRRFCLHILPPGFRKIRYYGFMANVNSALLQVQQKEMGINATRTSDIKKLSWKIIAKQKLNYDADLCPCCKKGKMITILSFDANGPPDAESLKALIELINLPDRQPGGKIA